MSYIHKGQRNFRLRNRGRWMIGGRCGHCDVCWGLRWSQTFRCYLCYLCQWYWRWQEWAAIARGDAMPLVRLP